MKRRNEKATPDVTAQPMGDYRPDGSLDRKAPRPPKGDRDSCLFWFIDSLVTKRRRDPDCPPREFALALAKSRFSKAFPTAHTWVPLVMPTDWQMLQTGSHAETTVKYCGSNGPWWNGGLFGPDEPPLGPRLSPTEISELLASLVDPISETG